MYKCPKRFKCGHSRCVRQETVYLEPTPVHEACSWYYKFNIRKQKLEKLNETCFYDYFYIEQELRKEKLEKLNEV